MERVSLIENNQQIQENEKVIVKASEIIKKLKAFRIEKTLHEKALMCLKVKIYNTIEMETH